MNAAKEQTNWKEILRLFSLQNHQRPTRLGVFQGEPGEMKDYWLADGLPLSGIDFDTHGKGAPTIEIMLRNIETSGSMTHLVRGAQSAKIILDIGGKEDGLEIKDKEGNTTFLRFEN
jgi:hypothetical protein